MAAAALTAATAPSMVSSACEWREDLFLDELLWIHWVRTADQADALSVGIDDTAFCLFLHLYQHLYLFTPSNTNTMTCVESKPRSHRIYGGCCCGAAVSMRGVP